MLCPGCMGIADVAWVYGYWTGCPPVITGPCPYGLSDMLKDFSSSFFSSSGLFEPRKQLEFMLTLEEVELRVKDGELDKNEYQRGPSARPSTYKYLEQVVMCSYKLHSQRTKKNFTEFSRQSVAP